MRKLFVKAADCSSDRLITIAERCGFRVFQGGKHYKVKTRDDRFIATIPRNKRLKRETVRGIVEKLIEYGATIELS